MSTQMRRTFNFRWPSLLGIAVILFLLWGAFNFLLAIFVPLSLHRNGAGAGALGSGGLVLTRKADAAAGGLVSFVYFVPVVQLYARYGVPLEGFVQGFAIPVAIVVVIILLATAFGWLGLRPGQRSMTA